jgi:cyclopropane-fatty-acyl-phospholipid synthase
MGEMGDFSGAMFNGDFSLSLAQAQRQKHAFIAENLDIRAGSRVLDLGCGWGPFLHYIRQLGASGIGVTLSSGQAAACIRNGLDVRIMDCRTVSPDTFGLFDAVVSIGSFEHFCSVDEYTAGKQEDIYCRFFETVSHLLPAGKRFYLQTMVFGKNMLPLEEIDIHADKDSDAYILALMVKQFPGSWLPYGDEQVIRCARPFFKLISQSSGRLDYIETIKRWRKGFREFNLKKYLLYGSLFPNLFTDKEFRYRVAVFRRNPNKICFEREIMEHYRFVFEKI